MLRRVVAVGCVVVVAGLAVGQLVPANVAVAHREAMEKLRKVMAGEEAAEGKVAALRTATQGEGIADYRREILGAAAGLPAAEREAFLTERLTTDEDSGLRSAAATMLGKYGSEKVLEVLVKTAAGDKTSPMQMGCMRSTSSARRAATFAIAEVAERYPALAGKAAAELKALPVVADPKDNESLADARTQALYNVTRDGSLLKDFLARLKSAEVKERVAGLVAFRFVKLDKAPPEVVASLKDPEAQVRSWAALVLGEIGDMKTAEALVEVAKDKTMDRGTRCNAVFGLRHMNAPQTVAALEALLDDQEVGVHAAIAIYDMTGKRVKGLPAEYEQSRAPQVPR